MSEQLASLNHISLDTPLKLSLDQSTEKEIIFKADNIGAGEQEFKLGGQSFMGTVVIKNDEYFCIESENSDFKKYIYELSQAIAYGKKIRKMNSERISTNFKGKPSWFYKDPEHELFFLVNDNLITFMQLNFQGNILEVNEKNFISSGELIESKSKHHLGSNLIGTKKMFNTMVFDLMLIFTLKIETLTDHYKKQILSHINKALES